MSFLSEAVTHVAFKLVRLGAVTEGFWDNEGEKFSSFDGGNSA